MRTYINDGHHLTLELQDGCPPLGLMHCTAPVGAECRAGDFGDQNTCFIVASWNDLHWDMFQVPTRVKIPWPDGKLDVIYYSEGYSHEAEDWIQPRLKFVHCLGCNEEWTQSFDVESFDHDSIKCKCPIGSEPMFAWIQL